MRGDRIVDVDGVRVVDKQDAKKAIVGASTLGFCALEDDNVI